MLHLGKTVENAVASAGTVGGGSAMSAMTAAAWRSRSVWLKIFQSRAAPHPGQQHAKGLPHSPALEIVSPWLILYDMLVMSPISLRCLEEPVPPLRQAMRFGEEVREAKPEDIFEGGIAKGITSFPLSL